MSWVFVDGRVCDASSARVPVLDRGFLYGDSVYEVTRTFGGRAHLLGPHLDRLERSADGIYLTLPPRGVIEAAVTEVIRAGEGHELYLRIVVTRGEGELGLDPALADAPRLVVVGRAVNPPPAAAYRDGVAVVLSSRRRSSPELKTGNYLESVLATREARAAGAHEALLRDGVGRITEGSSSNVFAVVGGRLVTPPVSAGLLCGITRQSLIELARLDGLCVDEVPLWPADLLRATELFLSSSIRGVLPVTKLDGVAVGDGVPGAVTKRVMQLYQAST
ncbi:MAG: aminotransferase class IV [Polyangia bacterium]